MTSLLVPALARAADGWQFDAVIYGYMPAIGGTTKFPPGTGGGVEIDADAILENLKFAFMGSFDASKGQFGVTADVVYADLGTTRSGTRELSFGGVQIPADASAKVDFDLSGWCWTVVGTYAAVNNPRATLQTVAGARFLDIDQHLAWEVSGNVASIPLNGREGSVGSGVRNWDGVVGVRGRFTFGSDGHWFIPYYADLGTGDSDFTWQAVAGLGYAFGWGDVLAAVRHIDYQMKPGNDIQRLTFSGPAVGVAFHW
jgi:hypothetical protein